MSMTTIQVDDPPQNTTATATVIARPVTNAQHMRDLLDIIKPRISSMVLVTVALAVFVASGAHPDLFVLLHTLVGTALVASSSGAFNQLLERESDALMPRTSDRPLPAGRMSGAEVIAFGLATMIAGTIYLLLTVGWQPTMWAIATWVVYVCIYTPMKTWTSWNTTVGAVSGALPILIGWAAVGSPMNWHVLTMFAVLFLWQFPHFIAIAWIYRKQYDEAGLRMVTTTDPSGRNAGFYSVWGAVLLTVGSLLPLANLFGESPANLMGYSIYGSLALILGAYQINAAQRFNRSLDDTSARQLLKASIIYLPLALGLIAVHTAL